MIFQCFEYGYELILPDGAFYWDFPCLEEMTSSPCGKQFKLAFSCFHLHLGWNKSVFFVRPVLGQAGMCEESTVLGGERWGAEREASKTFGENSSHRGHCKVMKEQEVLVPKFFQFREAGILCKMPLYRFL